MKKFNLKWYYLFMCLFMACSVPMLTSCSDDDDEVLEEMDGTWKDNGNTATVSYKGEYDGVYVSFSAVFTFDGSGDDALCIGVKSSETYPSNEYAQAAAAVYASEAEIFQNIKVDGNTVSYETNEFNGLSRQQLRIAFQQILDNL